MPAVNGKWCAALLFNEKGKAGKGERLVDKLGKLRRKHVAHGRLLGFVDASGQRHVETKVIHHMRITPKRQILPLAFGQHLRPAAGNIGFGQGRTEAVEMIHDLRGKVLQRLVNAIRHQSEEWSKCLDDNTRNVENLLLGSELCQSRHQLRFAVFFRKLEWRLQRCVETVTTRFLSHPGIIGVVIIRRAGKCIAAQPARCSFSQRMIFSRGKIDGIAHGKHSSVSWGTRDEKLFGVTRPLPARSGVRGNRFP
ncbi:hypothetical protein AT6N2_C2412 [Agrobacterium tumefaciens]|nr:hypothetical protein AT6N2_C2412 [Agrobacterium tumefaciens]